MAFTVRDFHDLVEILENQPAWRAEVRRLVLTDDILNLPKAVNELIASTQALKEAQRQNEIHFARLAEAEERNRERFDRIDANIAELKTDASGLKTDVSTLKTDVSTLKTDVSTLKTDVSQLKTDVSGLTTDVSELKTDVSGLKTDVGDLKGDKLERQFRDHPFVYFSRFARRLRIVTDADLGDLVESALDQGRLSPTEAEDLKRIDVVARGRRQHDSTLLYLVVEVSAVVDAHDLERAIRRAGLLHKATGEATLPVVAGDTIAEEVRQGAERLGAGWVIRG